MTDEDLYNFVTGQARHEVIERLFMVYPNRFKSEMKIQYEDVRGIVDIYDKFFDIVVDLKGK